MRFYTTVPGRLLAYAISVAALLFGANALYSAKYFPKLEPNSAGSTNLVNRHAWYAGHRNDYDLVFLGDSRTYCGVHAERIDALLGTNSINLAAFSNWLPTQMLSKLPACKTRLEVISTKPMPPKLR